MKTKTNKTKIGWTIMNRKNHSKFANKNGKYLYTENLEKAMVFNTRSRARSYRDPDTETVIKVSIVNGKPNKVIGGNGGFCVIGDVRNHSI
jgi:hypothetical protein